MVAVVEEPWDGTARLADVLETATVDPVPLKVTLWIELLALSVIVSVPVRLPAAVGVKVTEILQLAVAARLLPQVLVSAKSPVAAIEVMVSAAVPELVRVTVCAARVVLVG